MSDPSELQSTLEAALTHQTGSPVQISNLQRLGGGASQEIWQLDLWVEKAPWQGGHALILRWQLGGKIFDLALDRAGEFAVLQAAFEAGVPAPRPYWFLPDLLGRPAFLMQRVKGETIGRRVVTKSWLAGARRRLPHQMGIALAAIHAIDVEASDLQLVLSGPTAGQTPAQTHLARMEANLDRIGEPHPALELALRWLRRHEPPPPDRLVLVHGDFRIGNMVVNADGLVSILDWEFARLSDPAEDIGWPLVRAWRFGVDHLRFGGIGSPTAFLAAYEQTTGRPVDPAHVFYWEVMGNVLWAIGALNQAHRHLSGQATSLEFASLGRKCAEMELELLSLIQ